MKPSIEPQVNINSHQNLGRRSIKKLKEAKKGDEGTEKINTLHEIKVSSLMLPDLQLVAVQCLQVVL